VRVCVVCVMAVIIFLSAAEALQCQIELIGCLCGCLGGDYLVVIFFIKEYLKNYKSSEVESCLEAVCWEADAHPVLKVEGSRSRS